MRLHQSGDPSYEQDIVRIMGQDWYQELFGKKRKMIKVNREYYQQVFNKLNDSQTGLFYKKKSGIEY